MKKILFSLLSLTILSVFTYGQNNCEVRVPELQGQYKGECKKGLAHGEGSARGEEEYVGNFRKGLPHGFGVYFYKNGSTYIGSFKKGKRDGYGLLNDMSSGTKVMHYGLWASGNLAIPDDARGLYKVDSYKGVKMVIPEVQMGNEYRNQIFIKFTEKGVPTKTATILDYEISSGEYVENIDRTLNREIQFDNIEEFPVTLKLEYIYKQVDWRNQNCEFEVTLFTPGIWTIKLEHTL
ncbi:MAG TPA: hypothetical protein VJ877_06285 [Bacteroidales bacterium]|nr:hypothetical protein [Bacteroidales bacterium]